MSLRKRKKRETRERIVAAATQLFREKGYAGTRTKDIAEAAGIATGTLFNYAATKEDVVLLVWKKRAEVLVEEGLAAGSTQDNPIDALVAVFEPIFSFYAEDLELGRIFLQGATYAPLDDPEMAALNGGFIGRIGAMLTPFAGGHALHAAMNAFATYHTTLVAMLSGHLPSPEAATQVFRDLIVQQVRGYESPKT